MQTIYYIVCINSEKHIQSKGYFTGCYQFSHYSMDIQSDLYHPRYLEVIDFRAKTADNNRGPQITKV